MIDDPLASTPISGFEPLMNAPDPSPLPQPMAPQPHQGIDWMRMIGPLATIALAASGHPNAAIGAGHGSMLVEEQRRRDEAQQAELAAQQQAAQQRMAQIAAAEEAKRQQGIQSLITQTAAGIKYAKTKDDYDRIVNAAETMGAQFYGLPPNKIRAILPYRAPDAGANAYAALDAFMKNPANKEAIASGAAFQNGQIAIDTDGDGKPDKPVSLLEAVKLSNYPLYLDPTTNRPIVAPKGVDVTKLDPKTGIVLQGLKTQFQTDKGRAPNDQELGELLLKADRQVKEAEKIQPPAVNITMGGADKIDRAAQAVVSGRMSPSQAVSMFGGMGKDAGAFKREMTLRVLEIDPAFDFQGAESNYQFGKSTSTQNTVRYMSSVQESMPMLVEQAKKLGNGNVRSINSLINAGKNQFGDVDLKRFKTQVTLVADEVAKILQGGGTGSGTSDAKLRQAADLLNTSDSPAQIAAAIQDINTLIGFRKDALTKGTFMDKGKGGAITVTAPDGKTYSFASQEQADAFKKAIAGKQ